MKTKKKIRKANAKKIKQHTEPYYAANFGLISKTELKVLLLIVQGFDHEKIEQKLGIVYDTFKSHRTAILKKLKLDNIVQLTHFALHQGLLQKELQNELVCIEINDAQKKKLVRLAEKKKVSMRKYCEMEIQKHLKSA